MDSQVIVKVGCLGRSHKEDLRDTEGVVPFYYVLDSTVPTGLTQLQARCLWHQLQPKGGETAERDGRREQRHSQTGLCLPWHTCGAEVSGQGRGEEEGPY